jgi:hypothetical protein
MVMQLGQLHNSAMQWSFPSFTLGNTSLEFICWGSRLIWSDWGKQEGSIWWGKYLSLRLEADWLQVGVLGYAEGVFPCLQRFWTFLTEQVFRVAPTLSAKRPVFAIGLQFIVIVSWGRQDWHAEKLLWACHVHNSVEHISGVQHHRPVRRGDQSTPLILQSTL